MHAKEMIDAVRQQSGVGLILGRAGDTEILGLCNRAKDLLGLKIVEADEKYFETDALINFVAGQEEYDLPRHFKDDVISNVERLKADGTVLQTLDIIPFQRKEDYRITPPTVQNSARCAYIRDRKIGFVPKPAANETGAVKVYGIQPPHDMYYGKLPTVVAASSFVLPDAAPDLLAGYAHTEDSYYVNALIRVLEGTDRGLERKVTAYVSATRTITIDTAWTPGNVQTKQFAILCKIPEKYHDAIVQYAVYRLAIKGPKPNRELAAAARLEWAAVYDAMETSIVPRDYASNRYIQPPRDDQDWY